MGGSPNLFLKVREVASLPLAPWDSAGKCVCPCHTPAGDAGSE